MNLLNCFYLQFGEHIYWTDWYSKSVERADKTTGRDRISVKSELDSVMEIKAVSATRQLGWSPCQVRDHLKSISQIFSPTLLRSLNSF